MSNECFLKRKSDIKGSSSFIGNFKRNNVINFLKLNLK
jgi:hypothetical protein